MKGKRKAVIDVVRDAIARGASTVEEVVKSVSDMPLKKLGKLDPTRRLRKVQNESIGTVGEAIRDINEQVRAFAAEQVAHHQPCLAGAGYWMLQSTVAQPRSGSATDITAKAIVVSMTVNRMPPCASVTSPGFGSGMPLSARFFWAP